MISGRSLRGSEVVSRLLTERKSAKSMRVGDILILLFVTTDPRTWRLGHLPASPQATGSGSKGVQGDGWESVSRDFPGGPVVKNLPAQEEGHRFDPWSGKSPHAMEQLSPRASRTEVREP